MGKTSSQYLIQLTRATRELRESNNNSIGLVAITVTGIPWSEDCVTPDCASRTLLVKAIVCPACHGYTTYKEPSADVVYVPRALRCKGS